MINALLFFLKRISKQFGLPASSFTPEEPLQRSERANDHMIGTGQRFQRCKVRLVEMRKFGMTKWLWREHQLG